MMAGERYACCVSMLASCKAKVLPVAYGSVGGGGFGAGPSRKNLWCGAHVNNTGERQQVAVPKRECALRVIVSALVFPVDLFAVCECTRDPRRTSLVRSKHTHKRRSSHVQNRA